MFDWIDDIVNRAARTSMGRAVLRTATRKRPRFECPVCGYKGPFLHVQPYTGKRLHAQCPGCGAMERHRLQHLVLLELERAEEFAGMRMLHIAPEPFFRRWFQTRVRSYETADLFMKDVDHKVDLTALPFADGSYDLVYASHVLEHIRDDAAALREIRRVLRPGGLAVLPVPIVADATVEYPAPNPWEAYHVRAPGPDYFERYREHFREVWLHDSSDFDEHYQLYVYEDRSALPNEKMPHRPPMPGERHRDIVPVCRA